jgi:hypothetical protein
LVARSKIVTSTLPMRHHAALVAERHQLVELIDCSAGSPCWSRSIVIATKADVDQVLMDLVGGAADVNGRADLLGPEVVHEVLVVRLDELAIGVRPDQRARGVGSE